jgi:hypothetical protein
MKKPLKKLTPQQHTEIGPAITEIDSFMADLNVRCARTFGKTSHITRRAGKAFHAVRALRYALQNELLSGGDPDNLPTDYSRKETKKYYLPTLK